jgi:antitoxin (DNA-binding transcriptional repressor) of toxin-antitoxin stability system
MVAKPVQDAYDIDAAGDDLPAIVERIHRGGRPVVLTRGGEPVAAVVSMVDAEAVRAERWARIEASMKEISAALADVPLDEIERQVKQAIREVRAERQS